MVTLPDPDPAAPPPRAPRPPKQAAAERPRRRGRRYYPEFVEAQRISGAARARENRTRAAELDELRLTRPLSEVEQREADILANRIYMREWRQQQRIAAEAIAQRQPQTGPRP